MLLTCSLFFASTNAIAVNSPLDPFAPCRSLLEERSHSKAAASCVYKAGERFGARFLARKILESSGGGEQAAPWPTLYLGSAYFVDDPTFARQLIERAVRGFSATRDFDGEAYARTFLFALEIIRLRDDPSNAGALRAVQAELDAVSQLAERSGSRDARAWAAILAANFHLDRGGDFGEAHRLLVSVRDLVFPSGSVEVRRRWLSQYGNASYFLGKLDEAIAAADAHRALAAEDGSISGAVTSLFNRLNARVTRAELDPRAGPDQRLALIAETRATGAEIRSITPGVSRNSLHLSRQLGDLLRPEAPQAARELFEGCLEAAREFDLAEVRSPCLYSLARSISPSDPDRAEALSLDAIEAANGDASSLAYANQARLRLVWQIHRQEMALRFSWAALDAMESLRSNQGDELARAEVFGAWTLDYRWLAGKLLSLPKPRLNEAFEVGERLRARVLLEGLEGVEGKPLRLGARFAKLSQIAPALDPREALVWFSLAPEQDLYGDFGGGAWRLVVTRAGTTLTRLPDAAGLSDRVAAFSSLLSEREVDPEIGSNAAAGLYTALFGPSFESLPRGIERLTIAADGPLPRLPFEALRASAEAPTLGERFEIATVPSATIWLRLRKGPNAPFARPALVLADPEAERPLPWARREARAIRRALGGHTERWVGAEASAQRLASFDLAPFAVLHFAAHASADDAYPERSAIVLARGENGDDGHLEPHEIAKLKLDGRVVVLSACDSASGALVSGEGFLSLARAFFQARARSVVAARWPIRDDDAAFLFEHFYSALGRGDTVGAALRAARRAAIDEGLPPQAWAGVVLLGDGEARLRTEATGEWGDRWKWLALAVLGAALVFGAAAVSRLAPHRKRR